MTVNAIRDFASRRDLSMNGVTQVLCASCHNKVTQDRKNSTRQEK